MALGRGTVGAALAGLVAGLVAGLMAGLMAGLVIRLMARLMIRLAAAVVVLARVFLGLRLGQGALVRRAVAGGDEQTDQREADEGQTRTRDHRLSMHGSHSLELQLGVRR